jgi:uroporphyrinogen decarboxylase
VLPDNGAIMGGKPGPIQNRENFEKYPWKEIPTMFWQKAESQFDLLAQNLPPGMKAVGGVGNGALEICEDLVGFEYLSYMMFEDPELFADIFKSIGDLMIEIWSTFLKKYKDSFAIMRFGDDLGFKSSTLISPKTIKEHILPQYKRIFELVHKNERPFLWHSCGNIFNVMDDVIELGINAKHSNEDAIAPFDEWIKLYGDRIGLLGGIDVDLLCLEKPDDICKKVFERGKKYRNLANGYALGSGNSIPDYVPVEGYLAMIEAAQKIREAEL